MRTITIMEGITLTATEATIAEYERYRDAKTWEDKARVHLAELYVKGEYDLYSDLYKDVYGVRPRWQKGGENMTKKEMIDTMEKLGCITNNQRASLTRYTKDRLESIYNYVVPKRIEYLEKGGK